MIATTTLSKILHPLSLLLLAIPIMKDDRQPIQGKVTKHGKPPL
jgi:hypothetical protein